VVELWLAIAIMYNIGIPQNALYKIAATGPFESREECAVRVGKDKENLFNFYAQQGYKVIDVYCALVTEKDSVLDTPTSET